MQVMLGNVKRSSSDLYDALFNAVFRRSEEYINISDIGLNIESFPGIKKFFLYGKHIATVPTKDGYVRDFLLHIHDGILNDSVELINMIIKLPLLALDALTFCEMKHVPYALDMFYNKENNIVESLKLQVANYGRLEYNTGFDLSKYKTGYQLTIDNQTNVFDVPIYDLNVLINHRIVNTFNEKKDEGKKPIYEDTTMYDDLMSII